LSLLTNGSLLVQPDFVNLRGTTSDPDAQANIARMFAEKLGDAQNFKIDVTYIEPPEEDDPSLSAEACLDMVNTTQTDGKIAFAPGSDTIEGGSLKIVDAIAEILRECPDVQMEIGGHTDSQGRETMNTQLSQQRADAVMMALISRRVLTTNLTSVGYGESRPVADNGTEEGREANRRIEFTLPPKPDEADGEQPEPLEELATQSDQQTEADNEQN